jgi:hypothetical protein
MFCVLSDGRDCTNHHKRFFTILKIILFNSLTPGITEKKVPPRHQSRYIGSTLDVVYRKLKVVKVPITFAIES